MKQESHEIHLLQRDDSLRSHKPQQSDAEVRVWPFKRAFGHQMEEKKYGGLGRRGEN